MKAGVYFIDIVPIATPHKQLFCALSRRWCQKNRRALRHAGPPFSALQPLPWLATPFLCGCVPPFPIGFPFLRLSLPYPGTRRSALALF